MMHTTTTAPDIKITACTAAATHEEDWISGVREAIDENPRYREKLFKAYARVRSEVDRMKETSDVDAGR